MNIVVKMKFGAHLYGTASIHSDLDYKGIFMPTKEEVLLGHVPKSINHTTGNSESKNLPDDIDTEFYSIHYFIKMACDGQTVAMDMLHAPTNMIIENSSTWESIVKNREKFYSKNLNAFIRYSRRQASKYGIKGSRLNAMSRTLEVLRKEKTDKKLQNIWDKLPRMEHCYDIEPTPNGLRQYQICGKTFQETATTGYVMPILQRFYDEYGHRAKLAAENKNIDWKAVSHAFRAAYQTKEIFTRNTITFPLKDAPFLMKVKLGELDYLTEVAPVLETLMGEVEELVGNSQLPEKVDTKFWDDFLCDTLEKTLF